MTEAKRFYNDFNDITVCPPGKAEGSDDWSDYTDYQLRPPIEESDNGEGEFPDYEEIELTEILRKEINNGEC